MTYTLVPRPATLLSSSELIPEHRLMVFADSADYPLLPGQFINICVPGIGEFPVSTAGFSAVGGVIETCIRRAGRVTSALFAQPEGAEVGMRGPFGNGFPLESFAGRDALLVAGGARHGPAARPATGAARRPPPGA